MSAAMNMSKFVDLNSFFLIVIFTSMFLLVSTTQKHVRFGSKTAYELVHPSPENVVEDEYNSVEVGTFSCLAAHASFVLRHGSRNPGLDTVNSMLKIHDLIKGKISPGELKHLTDWTNSFPLDNEKTLMDVGEEEHYRLGQRTAKRLKTLYVDEDVQNFRFLVSSLKRTQDSATSFHAGFTEFLFGEAEEVDSELSDDTLRFHKRCQKYIHTVEKNKTARTEFYKFLSGKEMTHVLEKVHKTLGVSNNLLTTENVRNMYLTCGYETAVFNSSVWCDLFDEEDFKVLEYLSDLKHYYKNGPGHKITGQQSCPLVSDIFSTMDAAVESMEMDVDDDDEDDMNGYVLGSFYFGHAETLGPLYALLGLFNDSTPPTAENYAQQADRLYVSSAILPFSANLMLVMYECDQNDELLTEKEAADETRETTTYMLKMFVNEKVMKIPGCDDVVCPYEVVKKLYDEHIWCNFSKLCEHKHDKDRPKDEL